MSIYSKEREKDIKERIAACRGARISELVRCAKMVASEEAVRNAIARRELEFILDMKKANCDD